VSRAIVESSLVSWLSLSSFLLLSLLALLPNQQEFKEGYTWQENGYVLSLDMLSSAALGKCLIFVGLPILFVSFHTILKGYALLTSTLRVSRKRLLSLA
jgi:hypothetical protein